ncbi:hypothetical protein BDN70DRAFT_882433 [Pholiota conissans]|uniref:Uncharacterized protein n=1 Tax=Pholiota conissans TaxID=109636 RepID=A0A9P5YYQ4_9AGAR|nr:hypothetical protein BDN70DRAFT_882433 [Pholiota conissans]
MRQHRTTYSHNPSHGRQQRTENTRIRRERIGSPLRFLSLFPIKPLSGCSVISCVRENVVGGQRGRYVSTNQSESNVLLLCDKPAERAPALTDIRSEKVSPALHH